MHEKLIEEMRITGRALADALAPFRTGNFNRVPFPGSWTAGQVAEHVLKAESGMEDLLTAETHPAGRDPEQFIPMIRESFLDLTKKYKSAPGIMPSEAPKDWDDITRRLDDNRQRVARLLADADLDLGQCCELAAFPGVGLLTGYEWLCVMNTHTLRHVQQLHRIREIIVP